MNPSDTIPPPHHPLVTPCVLPLPRLPADLAGLRLLVVGDLHTRRARARHDAIVAAVRSANCDLLLLVGDYMNSPGDEPIAHQVVQRIVAAARPRLASVGVFGNHDSPALRSRLSHLPVTWLANASHPLAAAPLTLLGLDCSPAERRRPAGDLLATLLDEPAYFDGDRLRLLLTHMPHWLPIAASLGVDLVIAGHTHGGQVRLPGDKALVTRTPGWPAEFAAGVTRLGRCTCVVTRGLGESGVEGLRILCPPHMPLLTLEQAEQHDPAMTTAVTQIVKW